jgi:DNA-binding GntR family transcriptional regulator
VQRGPKDDAAGQGGRTAPVHGGTRAVRRMDKGGDGTVNDAGKATLAEGVYGEIKGDIFDFRLMPGQRFSENEVAARLGVSRTPVRQALYRLEHEGYIQVASKSGWTVRPFDFHRFEELYDVRIVLELAAAKRVCEMDPQPDLTELKETWLVPADARLTDAREVGLLDERFHQVMMIAAGNAELERVHREVAERIRVVRRLEFAMQERIRHTYAEHAQILRALLRRKSDQALLLLRTHIEVAKAEVRKITLHKFATARLEPERRARAR